MEFSEARPSLRSVDLYVDGGDPLSSYTSCISNGTVTAVISMVNPQEDKVDGILASLGVFASGVQFRGSLALVVQKGYSYMTVLSKGIDDFKNSLLVQNWNQLLVTAAASPA
jgi:hypothetical protein